MVRSFTLNLTCDYCGDYFDVDLDTARPLDRYGAHGLREHHAVSNDACVLDLAEFLAHYEGGLPNYGEMRHMCEACFDEQTAEEEGLCLS